MLHLRLTPNLARAASVRGMASGQVATTTSAGLPKLHGGTAEVQLSTHSNGVTVVSVERSTPLSTVALVTRLGSRFEQYEERGLSHMIRVACGLNADKIFAVDLVKTLQHLGADLTCVQGREHTMFASTFLPHTLDEGFDHFREAASNPAYHAWELDSIRPQAELELNELAPLTRASEMLHSAAFASGGLENSLYAGKHRISKIKGDAMKSFHHSLFTAPRTALVGINVDHQDLSGYAGLLELPEGQGVEAPKSVYVGGQVLEDTNDALTHVCLAVETGGARKDAITTLLLQRILGAMPVLKWSAEQGKLGAALNGLQASSSAFNYVYSDTGLLGANIVSNPEHAGKAVEAVAQALRSISVSEEELQSAKKALLLDLLTDFESPLNLAEDMGLQALTSKVFVAPSKLGELINAVTLGEVQATAKKLASNKLSLSAVGNLKTVPRVESL